MTGDELEEQVAEASKRRFSASSSTSHTKGPQRDRAPRHRHLPWGRVMRFLSVCSGIEAASVAWEPLGWQYAGVSEIEPFPRAVLQQRLGAVPVEFDEHRWTEGGNITPLFGDFTKIEEHHVGPVDLLVGGTPCQSFSIAGKRLGLDDPRGNLTLEFLALARRIRPRWLVWENVPGVLSHNGGRTFGTFLRFLAESGFERWAYRLLDAQYCRVGGFGRAVPQRRRRVFVVGYSGAADIHPRAVLFDRESLRGNPAPRREAGEGVAPTLAARPKGGGGLGTISGDVSITLLAGAGRLDPETETFLPVVYRTSPNNGAWETGDRTDALTTSTDANAVVMPAVADHWGVRRLTPTECSRLQGFPDDWARIEWRGKSADQCPDGPQYKAYGNSMAVNVMRWIGERIATVDAIQ